MTSRLLFNTQTKELFVNELNTLPGTLYHHLWDKSGIDIDTVLEHMLANGIKRNEEYKITNNADFSSNVLNEANSMKLQQN